MKNKTSFQYKLLHHDRCWIKYCEMCFGASWPSCTGFDSTKWGRNGWNHFESTGIDGKILRQWTSWLTYKFVRAKAYSFSCHVFVLKLPVKVFFSKIAVCSSFDFSHAYASTHRLDDKSHTNVPQLMWPLGLVTQMDKFTQCTQKNTTQQPEVSAHSTRMMLVPALLSHELITTLYISFIIIFCMFVYIIFSDVWLLIILGLLSINSTFILEVELTNQGGVFCRIRWLILKNQLWWLKRAAVARSVLVS